MSVCVLTILIFGHSFVRRLKDDLAARFDARAARNFHLPESGRVSLYGTGGRTVEKLNKYNLSLLVKYKPDIVILEIGTNDLSFLKLTTLRKLFAINIKFALLGYVKL